MSKEHQEPQNSNQQAESDENNENNLNTGNHNSIEQLPIGDTSILFAFHVIWVLLFSLLAAIWYRFVPLIVISTFLIVLFIIVNGWKRISLKNIKPTVRLSKSRIFVDEEFIISASLFNNKWFPLVWLEWIFPGNSGVSFGDEGDIDVYTVRFLWLLWYQKVEWAINGQALHRGVYNIGEVILRSGDGFRFTETEQVYNLDGKLYVYPRLVSVNVPNFRPAMHWGAKGKKGGFIEDPLLVIGTREYQVGDELRRFNWRASARTGKLQTNVYQPIVTEQLLIYIDVEGFVINEKAYLEPREQIKYVTEQKAAFESFLSVIASIAIKYWKQGISIGAATNGLNYMRKKMIDIYPGVNLTPFLDQLAQITQRVDGRKLIELDEMLHQGRLDIPLFIFCDQVEESHYIWYQQHKHQLSEVCFYYKNETPYREMLTGAAKSMGTFVSSTGFKGGPKYGTV